MGITISHKLKLNKVNVKKTLDRAENLTKEFQKQNILEIEIRRLDDYSLLVDIAGCETLAFKFLSAKEINKRGAEGWDYDYAVLTDDGKKELDEGYNILDFPHNEMYYCASFCKTQFAEKAIAHRYVAEITRIVASYCHYAEISDEGDYYNTGEIEDAKKAIYENGKMIDFMGSMLQAQGFEKENVIKGGETTIKPLKTNK